LVDGEVGNANQGDEDQRGEPEEALHAALGLDAVLAAGFLHLLAVVEVEGDEEDAGQDVTDEEPVRC
jgi:hypothetical protein